ncbi:hypothetical protein [Winogradskyella sp. SYSU M77433]|uniref:hypothetical protein n=1 Tax=Winogradskyella sp. SYSU M77433 TaxID=3042722 RepID=UPI0024815CDD|nr:hypothetical protein [Winogradskyella sp. SYSU M77433]MDH7914208.1 hypothetical protein [Winogradskyella sp. SYSU M77433]
MKHLLLFVLVVSLCSCDEKTNKTEPTNEETETVVTTIDTEAELAAIEELRKGFTTAIKENRFADLKNYSMSNVKSYDPDCGYWATYKRLREKPTGAYHYDSLVMRPVETKLVSDSIAYDFGTSSTYYTNAEGEHIELTATFLALLKKDKADGKWKLFREVANTRDME